MALVGLVLVLVLLECNHKALGLYYIGTTLVSISLGSIYSLLLRMELYGTGNRILVPENQYSYNLVITIHGVSMIFYVVMPVFYGGFGNFLVPVMQGPSEVGFPRTNGYSLLLLVPISISYLVLSVGIEFPGGTG